MKTRLTHLLGIEHPVVLASMAWVTNAQMVAAISNAGGLGTLGPNAGAMVVTKDVDETGERLRDQIRKVRSLTDKPFAVNFVVGAGGAGQAVQRTMHRGGHRGKGARGHRVPRQRQGAHWAAQRSRE